MIVFVKPREMKPRHAAALALVGWYLVALPTDPDGKLAAPLPQWIYLDGFILRPIMKPSKATF